MRIIFYAAFFVLACLPPAAASDTHDGARSELSALLRADETASFAMATEPRDFAFPRDHGPHPAFRNEWWYVTGNLDGEDGRRFGFELTIFRFALAPEVQSSPSAWRTNQVYVAHFAVTDVAGGRFLAAERYGRGAAGLAGAMAEPFRVWLGDWEIAGRSAGVGREAWRLRASGDDFGVDLRLDALRPPVLNGVDGLSVKSADPGNASYYYSITRWDTAGRVHIGDRAYAVTGLSWLDREWSTSALADNQRGWDWFALQLSDGSDLMFYNLRLLDGSQDPASAGTWRAADGRARYLRRDQVELTVTATWSSPAGGTYPSGWRLRVRELGLDLAIEPVMANQELFTIVRYWEGAVDVKGKHDGRPVDGRGYVELTGYAEDAIAPDAR